MSDRPFPYNVGALETFDQIAAEGAEFWPASDHFQFKKTGDEVIWWRWNDKTEKWEESDGPPGLANLDAPGGTTENRSRNDNLYAELDAPCRCVVPDKCSCKEPTEDSSRS